MSMVWTNSVDICPTMTMKARKDDLIPVLMVSIWTMKVYMYTNVFVLYYFISG